MLDYQKLVFLILDKFNFEDKKKNKKNLMSNDELKKEIKKNKKVVNVFKKMIKQFKIEFDSYLGFKADYDFNPFIEAFIESAAFFQREKKGMTKSIEFIKKISKKEGLNQREEKVLLLLFLTIKERFINFEKPFEETIKKMS